MYFLAPSGEQAVEHAFWENHFTDVELNRIREYGDSLPMETAVVGSGVDDAQIRKTKISWIRPDSEGLWIFDRLGWIARQLNAKYFNFDVTGFGEDLQYTVYGPDGDHYGWHMDKGETAPVPRKLSMVLQLSDPSEYEGGELQLHTSQFPYSVPRQKGLVYAFPSYVMHQVTPVTSGMRRSLVVWLTGPRFR